jgi:hypothetical protein
VKRLFPTLNAGLLTRVALLASVLAATPSVTLAQDEPSTPADEEIPGQTQRYAWGEGGAGGGAAQPAVHRFARIFASVGGGFSMRLYYDDRAPAEGGLGQAFIAPAYLQLRGGYFLEGDGDLQHGVGLGIATNLMDDPPGFDVGFFALTQWTLAPTYFLRIWLGDELQVQAHVGVPIALSGSYQSFGIELGIGVLYKFLSGFGLYAQLTASGYFAAFFQPLISLDAGLAIDYEVLP